MVATPARIALITQEYRSVVSGPDSGVVTKYGDLARDSAPDVIPTFFVSTADAQIFCDERLTLLKRDARRIPMELRGVETGLALDFSQVTPTHTVIDDERALNASMLASRIGPIDFGKDITTIENWG